MSAPAVTAKTSGPSGWMQQSETLLSFGMIIGLVVMLVPLPQWLLDVLLAANLAATTLLLLVTLSAKRALELTVFPSLLLLLTLYRLSLNVATTRLILLDGDAGHIVTAFGNYVVGGQLVVGLVIFLILVTIQFMVITKGAGRIAEVADKSCRRASFVSDFGPKRHVFPVWSNRRDPAGIRLFSGDSGAGHRGRVERRRLGKRDNRRQYFRTIHRQILRRGSTFRG